MGRVVSFMLDEKVDGTERERLINSNYDLSSMERNSPAISSSTSSLKRFYGSLPTVRDIIRLVFFCTFTVVGMTFISQAIPRFGWIQRMQSSDNSHGNAPAHMEVCQSNIHNTSLSMDFTDPTTFSFAQKSRRFLELPDPRTSYVYTTGSIEVRSTEKSSGSYVHVDLDISASDSQLISSDALGIAKTDSDLTITTPQRLPRESDSQERPCLHVSAIVTIATGARLEHLGIDSETLAVKFSPGLDYAESRVVETKTHFDSTSTYSRETIINVISATVTGAFPLYDLLSIHTESGSIHADVVPKNVSREAVKPAILRLSSNSGSIRSNAPTSSVPNRDYQTSISTSSGSIEAGILHGLRTSLRSINGQITANVYPYGHNDSRTDIEVHCTSDEMGITLHSSLSHPKSPLKKLYGYYRGVSGSLNLFYPAQWQGSVTGTTISGSLDLVWQGLKIIRNGNRGYVQKFVEAVRGEGEGKLEFHSTSGSIHLDGESGGL